MKSDMGANPLPWKEGGKGRTVVLVTQSRCRCFSRWWRGQLCGHLQAGTGKKNTFHSPNPSGYKALKKMVRRKKKKRHVFATDITHAFQRPKQSKRVQMGRCCVSDFSVPYGMDNNSTNNLVVGGMLWNTISIAANLGGRKSAWCCLFPNCRKAFTGDSINCLCGDLVHFWKRNVLSLWKELSQSYKGPQQIWSDFFPTLSLFCLLADKFFSQCSRSHSFPYPFAFPPSIFVWISLVHI